MVKLFLIIVILLAQNENTIRGFVKDANTGEPIEFAQVYLQGTVYGDVTDPNGYYVISGVPSGQYTLSFSYTGYEKKEIKVELKDSKTLTINVKLNPSIIKMQEIAVTARRAEFESEVKVSKISIRPRLLKLTPSFLESDLLRALQAMPGVTTASDFSSALYIRGGSPDEILVLLDGATVYNPFHMGGFFSTFDMEAIKEVDLYLGGFPAEYGNRISSVLSVVTKQGNPNKIAGMAGISLLSAKAFLEGPLPKGSFCIGGRRTYFDKLIDLLYKEEEFPYYFYDLHAKAGFDLSPTTKLAISGFYDDDVLNLEEEDLKIKMIWGNRSTSLFFQNLYGSDYLGKTYLTRGGFRANFEIRAPRESLSVNNDVLDYSFKTDFSYFKLRDHKIKFGVEGKMMRFNTGFEIKDWNFDLYEKADHAAIFLQDEWRIFPTLLVQAGMRGDYFHVREGNFFIRWKEREFKDTLGLYTWWKLAPRIGFKYFLSDNLAFKGFFGLFHQFLTVLNPGDPHSGFIAYFWTPIFKPYKPLTSTHYILGIERYATHGLGITLEAYYKRMYNLLIPKEEGEEPYLVGDGEAFGLDILLEKELGRLAGWLTYSLSFTKRHFEEDYYPADFEKPHNLNLVGKIPIYKGWNLSFRWAISSGLPYTKLLGRYRRYISEDEWEWVEIEGPKNGARLPFYHRLDLGLEKEFMIKGISIRLQLQVLNAYKHKNILYRYWDYESEPPTEKKVSMMPLLPSLGVEVRF